MVLPVPFCFLVSATFSHCSRGLVVAKQNVRISNLVSLRTVSFCPKHGFSIRSSQAVRMSNLGMNVWMSDIRRIATLDFLLLQSLIGCSCWLLSKWQSLVIAQAQNTGLGLFYSNMTNFVFRSNAKNVAAYCDQLLKNSTKYLSLFFIHSFLSWHSGIEKSTPTALPFQRAKCEGYNIKKKFSRYLHIWSLQIVLISTGRSLQMAKPLTSCIISYLYSTRVVRLI